MPDSWPFLLHEMERAVTGEDDRAELLRQARYRLERITRYERWGPLAIEDAGVAAALLRDAGMDALAVDCEDEFGIDAASVLRELDKETGQ